MMTYEATIEYLYTRLPMFSRVGAAAIKKGLVNIIALCEALDNPQTKFKSIHVAGTNGKGSTSHMLAAILQQAGYKTGLYTSPHLFDFGERIRVNGQMINRDFVIEFTERTKKISAEIEPSFFELTVAMAFEYFVVEKVEVAVVETGLGGRLDSTNILSPVLSIITNIGYDHMQLLGNTLPEIASEKAGIIKTNTPVVIGESLPETKPLFDEKAAAMGAPLFYAQENLLASEIKSAGALLKCNLTDSTSNKTEHFILDLPGLYQVKNLCTVLTAEKVLKARGFIISEANRNFALAHVRSLTGLRGRWEILHTKPLIIADVGHNEDGIRQIVSQLNIGYPNAKKHFILGFVRDKDIEQVLKVLPEQAEYYFTNAHIPRAMPHTELKELAITKGLHGASYQNINDALQAAKKAASTEDVIMICGSFFIIAELKDNVGVSM